MLVFYKGKKKKDLFHFPLRAKSRQLLLALLVHHAFRSSWEVLAPQLVLYKIVCVNIGWQLAFLCWMRSLGLSERPACFSWVSAFPSEYALGVDTSGFTGSHRFRFSFWLQSLCCLKCQQWWMVNPESIMRSINSTQLGSGKRGWCLVCDIFLSWLLFFPEVTYLGLLDLLDLNKPVCSMLVWFWTPKGKCMGFREWRCYSLFLSRVTSDWFFPGMISLSCLCSTFFFVCLFFCFFVCVFF